MAETFAWYIDGTFKIVKDPVKQLLTIHVVLICQEKRVSVPVCFILMARRRKIDYIAVLIEIQTLCNDYLAMKSEDNVFRLRKVMADFEIALWQALRELRDSGKYPSDLVIKGCYFHFTQAVLRKAMQFNLKKDYYKKSNSGGRVFIKWLMLLVLLPLDLMTPTFNSMHNKMKEHNYTKLLKLYKYYKDNWIHGPHWSIEDMSVGMFC